MACATVLHPAASPAQTPPGETVVSRETCSGLFVVPLAWAPAEGPSRPLWALFDTGGSNLFIDPDGLERISGRRIEAGRWVRLEDVTVAGLPFGRFRPRVRELDHLSTALGREIDVFLPFRVFADHLLTLDYPREEMRVSRGSLPEPDGVEVFSSRGPDRRPWLEVEIGTVRRKLLIDSGSSGTIAIAPSADLRWRSAPRPVRISQGMDDLEISEEGRLADSVAVGPLTFEDPIVALTEDTERFGARVLRHFVATFDQRARRVRLEAAAEGPIRLAPVRGIGALLHPREGDAWEVAQVSDGSPADRAGLRSGDRVTRIDGVPVAELGCRELDSTLGRTLRLAIRRGGEEIEVLVEVEVLVR